MARDVNKWANQFVKGCLRKRPYHSPEEARQKARKIAKASGVELHCYRCPDCGWYHLTRNPITTWKNRVF